LLIQNVQLGPWLHVASELRHFSRVAEHFERKGHQFVVLDVLVVAGGEALSNTCSTRRFTNLARSPAGRIEEYT